MIPPIIIRPSSLPMYPDCPRRQAAKMFPVAVREWGYTLGERVNSAGAAVGTATHSAVAHILQSKIDTGSLGNVTEMEHRGLDSLANELVHGVQWDDTTPSANVAQKQIVRQAMIYRHVLAPKITPIAVEKRLETQTKAGNTLSGQIDLTTEDCRDLKTGRVKRMNAAQYGAYSLLMRSKGGQPERIVEDFVKRVSLKADQPPPVEIVYDVAHAERIAARIIKAIESDYQQFMETGDPTTFIANPNSQLCSQQWCPAWGTEFCKEHAK